jgi:hypothetical protein
MGPSLAGKLGEAGALALTRRVVVDRFQCLLRPVPAAEWAVWVEVDLGVGLREVRSSNLRMYRAGA